MTSSTNASSTHWLRVLAVLWLLLYVPVYANAYGLWHFFFLCNTGIVLTAAGLLTGSRLLLSSQLLAAPAIGLVWISDAGWRLLSGHFLHGGTAYMWDATIPAAARILSLYHLAWPLLLIFCAARDGYDRRGFPLQCLVAALSMMIGLYVAPAAENINYLFNSPSGNAGTLSPELRGLLFTTTLCVGVYWPTHWLACRVFHPADRKGGSTGTVDKPNAAMVAE